MGYSLSRSWKEIYCLKCIKQKKRKAESNHLSTHLKKIEKEEKTKTKRK